MSYTSDPQRKILRIVSYLQKDLSNYTVDETIAQLDIKFNVGVFANIGRLQSQTHNLEIYRKFKGDWVSLLCVIEVDVLKFKQEISL